MSDDRAGDAFVADAHHQQHGAALAEGERIGPYLITAVEQSPGADVAYQAQAADDHDPEPSDGPPHLFHIRERARGAYDYARPVVALGLAHPHVLAPVAVLSQSDRDFLVTQALPGDARPARLSAADALAAGVALADALIYLHGGGVAHLRISPEWIAVHDGNVYLTGLEDAQLIHPLDPNASSLFARDVNFLAHTLGALASVSDADTAADDGARAALAGLLARADAGEFATAAQLGTACATALESPGAVASQGTSASAATPSQPDSGLPRFSLSAGSATSVGMVRGENQDAAAVVQIDLRDDASLGGDTNPGGLYLVADGMGGEERGELASRIATRVVTAEIWRGLALPLLPA